MDGDYSTERLITSGVPQGTVLGPILYLIFINFVTGCVSCDWRAFADDYKLYMPVVNVLENNLDNVHSLQRDLNTVKTTGTSWNLKLNVSKCVAIRFGSRTVDGLAANYGVDDQQIEFVGHARDLGVIIDDKLRFHQHVRTIVGKASGLMGDLLRSTVCRDPNFMVTLFVTHIRPIKNIALLYGIWDT